MLVVVLLVAGAAAGVALLRDAGQQSSSAYGRTSLTGAELIRALGPAVGREGRGRVEIFDADLPGHAKTIDFVLHDDRVDFVADVGPDMRIVAKGDVAVVTGMPPVNLAGPRPSGGSATHLEALPGVYALSLKTWTFQEPGTGAEQLFPLDVLFTRSSPADDGSTVWTGSWADPQAQRHEIRVAVDAAGRPVELRDILTQGPEWERRSGYVVRYSRWGQQVQVQVPEPTRFGTPLDSEPPLEETASPSP